MTVERVEFNPADATPAEPWHTLWCEWLRFHTILIPDVTVLIDWLERDEHLRQVRYPTVVYDVDGQPAIDGDELVQRVAVHQLEAAPRSFPALPPGARIERNPHR